MTFSLKLFGQLLCIVVFDAVICILTLYDVIVDKL